MDAEHEIDALEAIHRSKQALRQRDIARAIGLSLGMTNSILRRLAKKGYLAMRRVNRRNIRYIVSAKGIDEIVRRSYRYLRRTISHIVRYKGVIEGLVRDAKRRGCNRVVLVGPSELEFVVEYVCRAEHMKFVTRQGPGAQQGHGGRARRGVLVLLGEGEVGAVRPRRLQRNDSDGSGTGVLSLGALLSE